MYVRTYPLTYLTYLFTYLPYVLYPTSNLNLSFSRTYRYRRQADKQTSRKSDQNLKPERAASSSEGDSTYGHWRYVIQ